MSRSTADPTDLHEQVAAEIRRAIADGEAKPGERLPPAKDLAAMLGVNTNTVLRALRLLRDEGLLEFRADAASPSPRRPNAEPSSSGPRNSSTSPAARATAPTNSSASSKTSPETVHEWLLVRGELRGLPRSGRPRASALSQLPAERD